MKKIIAKFRKSRSVISIKTYKRPFIFIIATMVLINLIVLSIAAVIALLIDDTFNTFIDAFANGSMKWLLSPNSILAIENPKMLFLAVIVLLTGMILFSGTIIALTTNAIKDYFHKKQTGKGKIFLEEHIVILNWNSKVPELVADLLYISERKVTVMILAEINKQEAEKQITSAIRELNLNKKNIKSFNVLVKDGDPLIESDLDDISILKASTILIMNKDAHDEITKDMTKSDLNVIKVVLSVGRFEFSHNPPIVAEIKNNSTKDKIMALSNVVETLHEHLVIPICFDRRLGQIIAQTIINPKMKDVYLSLFSFKGAEVYCSTEQNFTESLNNNSHSIPIAKIANAVYFLAENNDHVNLKTNIKPEIIKLNAKPINEATNQEVYIIGKNSKFEFIINAFKQYEYIHKSKFISKHLPIEDLDELINLFNENMRSATLLLLSDEFQQKDCLDANIIDMLIYIESKLKNKNINLIVEILDPRNDLIIKDFNINNAIVSNKIISLLMSKIALFKETAPFYENLLTIAPNDEGLDDQAMVIKPVSELFVETLPINFKSVKSLVISIYLAFDKKIMPMGIIRDDEIKLFYGDLTNSKVSLLKDDYVIFMKL